MHAHLLKKLSESKHTACILWDDEISPLRLSAGCVENELGLREWLESQGHKYIVTGGLAVTHLLLSKYCVLPFVIGPATLRSPH